MKTGTRIKLTGLPSGRGLSNKLIGREGVIMHITDYSWADQGAFDIKFYTVRLDPMPRERTEKVISGLSSDKLEVIK